MTRQLHHQFHVLVYPCADLPGEWGAHCLELDLVTQGNSEIHAVEMMQDALRTVAATRMGMGLPPFEFRSAPAEDWQRLHAAEPLATFLMHIEGEPFSDDVTLAPSVARAS